MATTVARPAVPVMLRECRDCGQTKPIDEFPLNKTSRLRRCRACHRQWRREHDKTPTSSTERQRQAERRRLLGHLEVEQSPDPQPARLLRELLAQDRAFGLSFAEVFSEDVAYAVHDLRPDDRVGWTQAFIALEAAWKAGYEQRHWPGFGLSEELLDALGSDREVVERP